jgi:hypothetical protein
MAEYVLYHQHCGHVAIIDNYRGLCETIHAQLVAKGQHGWRIRTGASDEDITSLLRQERCDGCKVGPPSDPEVGDGQG